MAEDKILRTLNGEMLTACSSANRNDPDYLLWTVAPGLSSAKISNTPETRAFLDDLLRRFRRDASRLKGIEQRRTLRQIGEQDALAGKPIEAFYQIEPPKRGHRQGRLTESMRAEYEIGWKSAKRERKSL